MLLAKWIKIQNYEGICLMYEIHKTVSFSSFCFWDGT